MRLLLLALAALTLSLGACATAQLPETAPPYRVLFLGNSLTYTNDLPALVEALAEHDGRASETGMIALPNASLEDLWRRGAQRALTEQRWDAVVMQQGPSSLPESQANLIEWATRWSDAIRAHDATPALYMVWPSANRRHAFPAVVASYTNAAEAADATLLPAGVAWLAAWEHDPGLALYGTDGFHPSTLGTTLAALVIYTGLTGNRPDTLPPSLGLTDAETTALLDAIARVKRPTD